MLGDVAANSYALESFESTMGLDLNGDGTIGVKATSLIQTDGSTDLDSFNTNYVLLGHGSTSGPELMYGGSAVTANEFAGWTPIGAVQTSSGFEIAWKQSGTNDLTFWDVDSNGNFVSDLVGALSPTSIGTETYESLFNQDLNATVSSA